MELRDLAATFQRSYAERVALRESELPSAGQGYNPEKPFAVLGGVGDRSAFEKHNSADYVFAPHKLLTLIFVLRKVADGWEVLLGHKARGFGCGKWNGFGGKVELDVDSSVVASAARELEEECGIRLLPNPEGGGPPFGLQHVGLLFFQYPTEEGGSKTYQVHVLATVWDNRCIDPSSAIRPSEEMDRVEWFDIPEGGKEVKRPIPFEQMWADDSYWLPSLLRQLTSTPFLQWSCRVVGYVDFRTMLDIRGYLFSFGSQHDMPQLAEGVPVFPTQEIEEVSMVESS